MEKYTVSYNQRKGKHLEENIDNKGKGGKSYEKIVVLIHRYWFCLLLSLLPAVPLHVKEIQKGA